MQINSVSLTSKYSISDVSQSKNTSLTFKANYYQAINEGKNLIKKIQAF